MFFVTSLLMLAQTNYDGSIVGISTSAAIFASAPEVAYARSLIYSPHLRGGVGENHMHTYISQILKSQEKIRHVPVNLGRQGIDGIYVMYGSDGFPRDLIVSEAKYGTSQLGMTKDGIQLGRQWSSRRLIQISDQYDGIVKSITEGAMKIGRMPDTGNIHRLQVQLRDGKAAVFWRRGASGDWTFAGTEKLLDEAKLQYQRMAGLFRNAAANKIDYQRILYKVRIDGNVLTVSAKDANQIELVGQNKLPLIHKAAITLGPSNEFRIKKLVAEELYNSLAKNSQLSNVSKAEIELLSSEILRQANNLDQVLTMQREAFLRQTIRGGMLVGGLQAAFDLAISSIIQLGNDYKIDTDYLSKSTSLAFASGLAGYTAGQQATVLIYKSRIFDSLIKPGSTIFGQSSKGLIARTFGGTFGGSLAVAIYSYGGFLFGYSDINLAHRSAIIGLGSMGAGALGSAGIFSAAVAFGTASTGTAISSLGGAAATNAALAYLGGGAISAGGFGVAGGLAFMSGGTVLFAIGGGYAVGYVFKYLDEKNETEKIRKTMEYLKKTDRHFFPDSVEENSQLKKLKK